MATSSDADILKDNIVHQTLNYLGQKDIFFKTGVGAGGLNLPVNLTFEDFQATLGVDGNNLQEFFTVRVNTDDIPSNVNDEVSGIAQTMFLIVSPFMLYYISF